MVSEFQETNLHRSLKVWQQTHTKERHGQKEHAVQPKKGWTWLGFLIMNPTNEERIKHGWRNDRGREEEPFPLFLVGRKAITHKFQRIVTFSEVKRKIKTKTLASSRVAKSV